MSSIFICRITRYFTFVLACEFELKSLGYEDPSFDRHNETMRYIKVNGQSQPIDTFTRSQSVSTYSRESFPRGIALVTMDTSYRCQVNNSASEVFDTNEDSLPLANYLTSLESDTMIAGICIDACRKSLNDARPVLENNFGIFIQGNQSMDSEWFRGGFAFLAWKNIPGKAQLIQKKRGQGPVTLKYST